MKKLCSLLLSVIMAVSLAVPAFAAETAGPPWRGAGSIGVIGGADGPTAILVSGPAGSIHNEKFDRWTQANEQALIDARKSAVGGKSDKIGIMVNGSYIKFPDAAPEIVNDCTMVPVRPLVEALGGDVAAQGDKVVCKTDEVSITFTVGSADVVVEHLRAGNSGEAKSEFVTMPCVTYIKDKRTYVPVRFIAWTLGYEVGWDEALQTVVLLDRDSAAEDWDQSFTIINRVLASSNTLEKGKNYRTDLKGSAAFTAFDTMNGDKTYTANVSTTQLMNAGAVSGSASLGISKELLDLLLTQSGMAGGSSEMVQAVADALEKYEFILNQDGVMWVHSDGLDKISGEGNAWFGYDLGVELPKSDFTGGGRLTMGRLLAAVLDADSAMSWSHALLVRDCVSFLGDASFTTFGGSSSLTMDLNRLDPEGELGLKERFKVLRFTLSVDEEGGTNLVCRAETASQSGVPAVRMTMVCTQSGQRSTMTLDAHAANIGQLKLNLNVTQQTTGSKPMSEPPAGANIVEAPALLKP